MDSTGSHLELKVLFVCRDLTVETATGRAARALIDDLKEEAVIVIEAVSAPDAAAAVASDTAIQCVVLDWNLPDDGHHDEAVAVLREIRKRSDTLPVFLLSDRGSVQEIPVEFIRKVDDFIWLLGDTPDFISGRILAAATRYRQTLLPPMFRALIEFAGVHEYSWHTPGHTGGTAFLKSPAGRAFFSYFGENLLRSDLSISVGELGSLLDHSGPIGKSEQYAAEVFGSHRTYYVTNGSSTSNRVILMASVTRDQVTLCDRNCHKSVEHAMTMTGAIPAYLRPSRNRYGIIGPIYPERLDKEAIAATIRANPLVKDGIDPTPAHVVITNSTYDGLCYNVRRVVELLNPSVDRLHFDEAWYGYARFNPLYKDRFAMYGSAEDYPKDAPTVFATQSTHKLLAALSQASMIHVRDGRSAIAHQRFNESFMMHASTSPQYAIIASTDVSAAMMDGPAGKALTTEAIEEAVAFRQFMSRTRSDYAEKGEWFFDCWQPRKVGDVPFYEASPDTLLQDPSAWVLHPGEAWHGFEDLEDDYCMLDPIKVSVLTPGMGDDGAPEANGIPASVVASYLDHHGIVVEKTTDFTILFLFSIGVTKGKWGSLLNALLDFKRDYDADVPLKRALPALVEGYPSAYSGMGLKELCDGMFHAMKELKTTAMMAGAFSELPCPALSPIETYERLVRNDVESVGLDALAGRVAATGVVPYPPGIPLLMPGENAGAADGAVIGYLKSLESFDLRFPGFGHDTHGVEVEEGRYRLLVLRDKRGRGE
jgi:arginine/lysine/ornithine decarboxylase/CheY-like chemotaxis protein